MSKLLNFGWGQADMLFVPLSQKNEKTRQITMFLELAQIFIDHQVFLECSIPSILSFMEQKIGSGGSNSAPSASMHDTADEKEDQVFDIKMVELCTTRKKKLREETDAWLQACSFSSSIYHPVKIGTTESSVAAWTKRFEEISVRERSSCVWAC